MKTTYKILGIAIGVFFIVVFFTATICFIKNVWLDAISSRKAGVAVYEIKGILYNASSITKLIEQSLKENKVKAAVVRIDSPGGLVGPSQELYSAFKKLDEKLPVIMSIQSLGASGGYYVALGGRKIFANPGSITASIGVIMQFINAEGLYKWAKIEHYSITSGKYKSIGSPYRPMTKEEKEILLNLAKDIHSQFINEISKRRKLPLAEIEKIADGRILSGSQAVKYGLIDGLGDFDYAVSEAKKLAGLDEHAPIFYIEPKEGAIKKFLFGETSTIFQMLENLSLLLDNSNVWRIWLISPVVPTVSMIRP